MTDKGTQWEELLREKSVKDSFHLDKGKSEKYSLVSLGRKERIKNADKENY